MPTFAPNYIIVEKGPLRRTSICLVLYVMCVRSVLLSADVCWSFLLVTNNKSHVLYMCVYTLQQPCKLHVCICMYVYMLRILCYVPWYMYIYFVCAFFLLIWLAFLFTLNINVLLQLCVLYENVAFIMWLDARMYVCMYNISVTPLYLCVWFAPSLTWNTLGSLSPLS